METRVTNNSSITNYENAFHTLGLDHMIHMLEPIRTAYTHDKEYLIVREHKKLDAFLAKQEKSIYIRTGEWCGVTQITPPKTADKKIKIEQNKEQYIDREMSYKKYYKTIMIPSASVIEVCKKVNRKHRDKTTSRFIKNHISEINDEFITYRDALVYLYDFITSFKGIEPPYKYIHDPTVLGYEQGTDSNRLFMKLARVATIAYKATKANNSKTGNKERTYQEVKISALISVTREKYDNTTDIIMRNLYKEGDFCEIDTSKDRKRQIAQIRLHSGIQNINVAHMGEKITEYINKAFKYGYINNVQTKEHIEKMGFEYNKKWYLYQYTEEMIIKMSLNYTKMSEFKKYNFNMWMDAERKGMLELMSLYCYHSSGRGGFNVNVPGLLYYIKSQGIYKIGITNLTVEQRFSHVWHKIEIIKTWFFDNGQEARDEEKRILREFAYAKHNGENIKGLGNTELFTHDVLLLDNKD